MSLFSEYICKDCGNKFKEDDPNYSCVPSSQYCAACRTERNWRIIGVLGSKVEVTNNSKRDIE